MPAAMACRLRIPDQARGRRRELVRGPVDKTRLDHPPHEVVARKAARDPGAAAACKKNLAARLVQLLSKLAARLAAADDEDAAGRQLGGASVVLREALVALPRHPLCPAPPPPPLIRSRTHH